MFGGPNFHTVFMSAEMLAVRCQDCRRGRIFTPETMPAIHRGNMITIASLRFVCDGCQGRNFKTFIPRTREQAEAFIAGADPESWPAR